MTSGQVLERFDAGGRRGRRPLGRIIQLKGSAADGRWVEASGREVVRPQAAGQNHPAEGQCGRRPLGRSIRKGGSAAAGRWAEA